MMATAVADTSVSRLKFVQSNAEGLPLKRKQVNQACPSCKKRKKRCSHAPDSCERGQQEATGRLSSSSPQRSLTNPVHTERGLQTPVGEADRDVSDAASQLLRFSHQPPPENASDRHDVEESSPNFIGDTNPEGIFIAAVMANIHKERNYQTDLGVWGHRRYKMSRENPSAERAEDLFSNAWEEFIKVIAASVLPADETWEVFKGIYNRKIRPLFPVFEERHLENLPRYGQEQSIDMLVKASVCLAAASDADAARHLMIRIQEGEEESSSPNDRPVMDGATFRCIPYAKYRCMLYKLIRTISQGFDPADPGLFHYIRSLILTYLFCQPTSSKEQHDLAILFASAMDLVHAHGLHLSTQTGAGSRKPGGNGTQSDQDQQDDEEKDRLFMCVYAMDRMSSAFNGRPLIMNNRDLRWRTDLWDNPRIVKGHPTFALFMLLIFLLDDIIELYRPSPSVHRVDPPVFERMILKAGAQNEPEDILATLEVFYHAASILSVRMHHSDFTQQEAAQLPEEQDKSGDLRYLPDAVVNSRRSLSSHRIVWLVKQHRLSPMPFVPYALSLAMTVAYRKWRFSQIPMYRARGRGDFECVLGLLSKQGEIFSSANINSRLGHLVMAQMKKAEEKMRQQCQPSLSGETTMPSEAVPVSTSRRVSQAVPGAGDVAITAGPTVSDPSGNTMTALDHPRYQSAGAQQWPNTGAPPGAAPKRHTTRFVMEDPSKQYVRRDSGLDHSSLGLVSQDSIQQVGPQQSAPERASDSPGADMAAAPDAPYSVPIAGYDLFPYFEEAFPTTEVDLSFFNNLDPTLPFEWCTALNVFEAGGATAHGRQASGGWGGIGWDR